MKSEEAELVDLTIIHFNFMLFILALTINGF
ncbi:Uncharacterised protein [Lysinibacillus sphaericus]|uniref:Uncharacterized protein n=1 Tax=Lysinibacillus sphaericus TaxID=1421 RepID=A0AAJ4ZRZ1_LYSSH|nr:hypothetical protein T479_00595 [Lysinibacillus varians]SUV15176.1 Uncharacterised protein [Lysinibacillus sphaericus]